MKKFYILPFIKTVRMDEQEYGAVSGGDIHGPGDGPPVDNPGEWDTRKMIFPDGHFEFDW